MRDPWYDPTSVGHLAIASGMMSRATFLKAAAEQRSRPDAKVGQLLVEQGAITRSELDAMLEQQERVRAGRPTPSDVAMMADYALTCINRTAGKLEAFAKRQS